MDDPAVSQAIVNYSEKRRRRVADDFWIVFTDEIRDGKLVLTEQQLMAFVTEEYKKWSVNENITHISCSWAQLQRPKHLWLREIAPDKTGFCDDARVTGYQAQRQYLNAVQFIQISRYQHLKACPLVTRTQQKPQSFVRTLGELCLNRLSPRRLFSVSISGWIRSQTHSYYLFDDDFEDFAIQLTRFALGKAQTNALVMHLHFEERVQETSDCLLKYVKGFTQDLSTCDGGVEFSTRLQNAIKLLTSIHTTIRVQTQQISVLISLLTNSTHEPLYM